MARVGALNSSADNNVELALVVDSNGDVITDAGTVTSPEFNHVERIGVIKLQKTDDDQVTDEAEGCLAQWVVDIQSAVRSFRLRHKKLIDWFVVLSLGVAYLAYFSYAMFYSRLADEPSVRLLWITCLVGLFVVVRTLTSFNRCHVTKLQALTAVLRGRRQLLNRFKRAAV